MHQLAAVWVQFTFRDMQRVPWHMDTQTRLLRSTAGQDRADKSSFTMGDGSTGLF